MSPEDREFLEAVRDFHLPIAGQEGMGCYWCGRPQPCAPYLQAREALRRC